MKPYILIVDDNKITTKLLRRYVETNGYDADEAYDGIECLEKIAERRPDVIVLDVMMPRMDGYETVVKIKADDATKSIPVVIVTALNDVTNQIKTVVSGADDFLSKPIEEKLLIAKIKLLVIMNELRRKNKVALEIIQNIVDGKIQTSGKSSNQILEDAGY